MVSKEDALANLSESLEEHLSGEIVAPANVEEGMSVCAKFTEDEAWYRSTVEKIIEDQYVVRFIDYGNTDTVSSSSLANIPEGLDVESIPAFACKCRLSGLGSNLEEEQVNQLKSLIEDQEVKVEFVSKENDVDLVKVMVQGKDLLAALGLEINKGKKIF